MDSPLLSLDSTSDECPESGQRFRGNASVSSLSMRCKALLSCSVCANFLGVCVLLFFLFFSQDYEPIAPPPQKNASKAACPFLDDLAPGKLESKSIVVTARGPNYLSICWKDHLFEKRGLQGAPYEVKIDDWWMSKSIKEVQPLYRGRALSLNITDLLPSTKYTIQLSVKSGLLPKTYKVTSQTIESGYCGNQGDVQAYKDTKTTMKESIQLCMIGNVFSDERAKECIMEKTGLSAKCSQCWVAEGHCTLERCATKCLNPAGNACKACSEDRCFPDAVRCSGMPLWSFPP